MAIYTIRISEAKRSSQLFFTYKYIGKYIERVGNKFQACAHMEVNPTELSSTSE